MIDVLDEIEIEAPVFPLAQVEQQTLERCESIIRHGVATFIEVGEALSLIQQGKLYREHYTTFEDYCFDHWGIGRARAYQLMSSSKVASELSTVVDKPPKNEREAREIAKSAPADRPRVIDRATELAGAGARTAKHIEQAAAEIARPDLPLEFAVIQRRYASRGHVLSAAWDGAVQRFVVRKDGGTGVVMTWPDVLSKLERLDDQAEYDEEHPEQVAAREPSPSPRPVSATVASYDQQVARDEGRIERARSLIEHGEHAAARTVLDQIEVSTLARDRLLSTIPAGRAITLALTPDDCAALLREARQFSSSGLTAKLPTIGRTLVLLIEAIKGGT